MKAGWVQLGPVKRAESPRREESPSDPEMKVSDYVEDDMIWGGLGATWFNDRTLNRYYDGSDT